jgi:hypothetical protein
MYFALHSDMCTKFSFVRATEEPLKKNKQTNKMIDCYVCPPPLAFLQRYLRTHVRKRSSTSISVSIY